MGIISKIQRWYFFYGEDDYLKWKKVKGLINSVIEKGFKDFDYNYFEGRGLDAPTLINSVSSPPFGSPLKIAVLRNFEKVSPKNQEMIAKFLEKIPDYSSIAITCGKLDGRDKRKKIYKTILDNKNNCVEFKQPLPEKAVQMLTETARELGIDIDISALEYLVETVGCDLGILEQELRKMAIYAGEEETIREEDVAQLIGAGALGTAFDLPAKIVEGNVKGALKLLRKLLLTKESEGTILFRIKDFFLKLNFARNVNASPYALMKQFKFSKKAADIISPLAASVSGESLINCLHDIYECEISLKSARLRKDLALIDLVSRLSVQLRGE